MRGKRRVETGQVTSDKMDKTIKVTITRRVPHPLYGKIVARKTTLMAHDEKNEAQEGDIVEVMETRQLSKTKKWRLNRVVKKPAKV